MTMTEPISKAEYLERLRRDAEAGDPDAVAAWERWQDWWTRHADVNEADR
jgi:hypothetical protein